MIIVLKKGATQEQLKHVVEDIRRHGFKEDVSKGDEQITIGVKGQRPFETLRFIGSIPFVEEIVQISKPYKLVSSEYKRGKKSLVTIGNAEISNDVVTGGKRITLAAGPCAIEDIELMRMELARKIGVRELAMMLDAADGNEKRLILALAAEHGIKTDLSLRIAKAVKAAGASVFRGGGYKPRTSPYTWEGDGIEAIRRQHEIGLFVGMPTVTEMTDYNEIEEIATHADMIQVGMRNSQNFKLLDALGRLGKDKSLARPVLLKRGKWMTLEEVLLSAERICHHGNPNVILCLRGVAGGVDQKHTRNLVDIPDIPVLRKLTHLPIWFDPSHSTGKRDFVPDASLQAVIAGADGLIVDVHSHPDAALVDAEQALTPSEFEALVERLRKAAEAVGRTI